MKFLCVPCDTPMKLKTLEPPDRGSLAVVYTCPDCGYEMAMLTNAYETQVVQSLGVRIGPATPDATRPTADATRRTPGATGLPPDASRQTADDRTKGCPFAAMIPGAGDTAQPAAIGWTAGAEARLANIPSFVRPMARIGIEQFAKERGARQVDEAIIDAAREHFGM